MRPHGVGVLSYSLTHPEVRVEPEVPVTRWSSSATGRGRVRGLGWSTDVDLCLRWAGAADVTTLYLARRRARRGAQPAPLRV